MKFAPKTEKEIQELGLLPAGTYDFEVVEANDKVSKSGNDMIELKLHVFDANGSPRIVMDWLLEKLAYKLRHAADACNLLDKYEAGEIHSGDFLGRTGQVRLKIDKDETGQHADKNAVRDYVKRSETKEKPAIDKTLDDEIPF